MIGVMVYLAVLFGFGLAIWLNSSQKQNLKKKLSISGYKFFTCIDSSDFIC